MVTAPKNGDFLVHHCGASLETLGHIDMRVCVCVMCVVSTCRGVCVCACVGVSQSGNRVRQAVWIIDLIVYNCHCHSNLIV